MSKGRKPRLTGCTAYKLLRVRRDGTLGPLFINRQQEITKNRWLKAEDHPTKGYAHRPGWHAAPRPFAPHLTLKGRIWMIVKVAGIKELRRPEAQGGTWWLAKWMKVLKPVLRAYNFRFVDGAFRIVENV